MNLGSRARQEGKCGSSWFKDSDVGAAVVRPEVPPLEDAGGTEQPTVCEVCHQELDDETLVLCSVCLRCTGNHLDCVDWVEHGHLLHFCVQHRPGEWLL